MEEIKEMIATCIYNTLNNEEIKLEDIKSKIEVPKDKQNGDFAYPCFNLAKVLKKSHYPIRHPAHYAFPAPPKPVKTRITRNEPINGTIMWKFTTFVHR